jgi:hypothetical protein
MSAEAINQLYIDVYGRPASQEEISYHVNRFGPTLDEIESQSLQREMTSVPGYTPPEKTAEAGVDGTPPSQPPEAPAEAPQQSGVGYGNVPTGTTATGKTPSQFKSQLDDVYQKTFNRPATDEEVSYYKNVYGDSLDDIERKDLFGRMLKGSNNQSVNLYRDILGRDPESPEAMQAARGLSRQDFFQRALPELRQTNPVFSTFQQVLGRDPGLAGLEYYRNVRPDLMQDPRAFRQAAIQSGEFGNRLRDLYRQNMGYDPSAQAYQGLMQSGTFLNPYEFRGAVAKQNIANRSRYSDYNFNPYSQNYMNQYQSNRMGGYKAPVMVSPTEEDRKKYFSKDRPQLFSSGDQFSKNTQSFNPYSQQPSPMGGGKGGRPSGTIGMGAAPAGIGGKR